MKYLLTLTTIFILNSNAFCFTEYFYIEIKPVSCQSFTYDIILHYTLATGSDFTLGAYPEIFFGDSERVEFELYSDYILINDRQRYYKQTFQHTYPGPGQYNVAVRIFNRVGNIRNMTNSINTPLYIESQFAIDPLIGCNSTPHIENLIFPTSKNGQNFLSDLSVIDAENDSVSFEFAIAYQDKDIEAINYEPPTEFDPDGVRIRSRILVDPFTGMHLWNTSQTNGVYCTVIKMKEWRKLDGEYYQISESTIDFLTDLLETNNVPPEITGLKDTAIVAGHSFIHDIQLTDSDEDSIQMLIYGDFVQLFNQLPENVYDFHPGPLNYAVNFQPQPKHVRSKPYKLLISGTDKNKDESLNQTRSMLLWIAEREHTPSPPANLLAQSLSQSLVGVYWNDSDDELGYILERADDHFPEFQKIATLPADATSFMDSNVVENNTYRYRIKAVGTSMSEYSVAEASTPDIVTALGEEVNIVGPRVCPNPSNGQFTISGAEQFDRLHIVDVTGKTVIESALANFNAELSPKLKTGIYIVKLLGGSESKQLKLEVIP
jgi:hypothetical protein